MQTKEPTHNRHDPERWRYPRAGAKGDEEGAAAAEELCEDMYLSGVEHVGPTLVKGYSQFFRRLPIASLEVDKSQSPLLYALLGSGTTPLKMSKPDAGYMEHDVAGQKCSTCSSAYQQVVTSDYVCSQVEGKISPESYCRLWNQDRN